MEACRPELGATPSPRGITRSAAELHAPMLAMNAAQAMKLGRTTGVPYAAIATLAPNQKAGEYALTYQVIETLSGAPVDATILLSGTQAQIIRQLPQLASQLWNRLGLTPASTLSAPTMSGADMQAYGAFWRHGLLDAQAPRFTELAVQPGNGFLRIPLIYSSTLYSEKEQTSAVRSALKSVPNNPEAVIEAVDKYPNSLVAEYPPRAPKPLLP